MVQHTLAGKGLGIIMEPPLGPALGPGGWVVRPRSETLHRYRHCHNYSEIGVCMRQFACVRPVVLGL